MAIDWAAQVEASKGAEDSLEKSLRAFYDGSDIIGKWEELFVHLKEIPKNPGAKLNAGNYGHEWIRHIVRRPCALAQYTRELIELLQNPLFAAEGVETALEKLREFLPIIEAMCALFRAYQSSRESRQVFERLALEHAGASRH